MNFCFLTNVVIISLFHYSEFYSTADVVFDSTEQHKISGDYYIVYNIFYF